MGDLDNLVDMYFKKEFTTGKTIFYPWGAAGKGIVLPDHEAEKKVKGFVRRFLIIGFLATIAAIAVVALINGLKYSPIAFCVVFPAVVAWYCIRLRNITAEYHVSGEKLLGMPGMPEKLKSRIDTYTNTFHKKAEEAATFSEEQKRFLQNLFFCVGFYAKSVLSIIENDQKLSQFINKDSNVANVYAAACAATLGSLSNEGAEDEPGPLSWALPALCNLTGLKEHDVTGAINEYKKLFGEKADKKDVWLKYDLDFCGTFLNNRFDIVQYYFVEHLDELPRFSLASQMVHASLDGFFRKEAS